MTNKYVDKSSFRHDYEVVKDATSRLAMYALAGGNKALPGETNEHAQRLAKRDIKSLAISLRRLVEVANIIPLAQNRLVTTGRVNREYRNERVTIQGAAKLWDLLGLLVHVVSLEFFD
jgi:hypothetical protein